MLNGMDGAIVEHGLTIGLLHTDIEGGNHFVSYYVLATDINATQQFLMIDGKGWYLIHNESVMLKG